MVRDGSTPAVTTGQAGAIGEMYPLSGPQQHRRWRPLIAATLGALLVVIAIGAVGLWAAFSNRRETPSQDPATSNGTVATSTPPEPGSYDGTTAVLPEGFSPIDVTTFDSGLVILATDAPPTDDGLPSVTATLFIAESDTVRPVVTLEERPNRVAWDGSNAWVAHFETGRVSKIDPATGHVLGTVQPELAEPVAGDDRRFIPNDLEAGLGSVWLLTARGAVAQIDAADIVVDRVVPLVAPHPSDLAIGSTRVWVSQSDGALVGIDPGSGATTTYPLSHEGRQVVASGNSVFVWGSVDTTSDTAVTIVNEGIGPVGVVDTGSAARGIGTIGDRVGVLFEDGSFSDVYYSGVELGPPAATTWAPTARTGRGIAGALLQLGPGGQVSTIGLAAAGGAQIPVMDVTEPRPIAERYVSSPDWAHLAPPPFENRWPAASVWTGSEVIVFGGGPVGAGGQAYDDGARYDPARDEWRVMPPIPITVAGEPSWVWTGTELMVWYSEGSAAAYSSEADAWRTIDDWPLSGTFYRRAIWTGSEIIDVGAGLAVEPADGSARSIAPAPAIPGRAEAVWTGDLVVLSTGGPAYRPATDEWIDTGPNGLTDLASEAAWTGRDIIAVDYESGVARFDPAGERWEALSSIPFNFGEWLPDTQRLGDTVVVVSWSGVLAYQRDEGLWTHFAFPTAVDASIRLIPAGDELYAFDGGFHRLETPITAAPLRMVVRDVIVDRPPGWEPDGEPIATATATTVRFRHSNSVSECTVTVDDTDAWRALGALPPGDVISVQPVVGGKPIVMVETSSGSGVTLSWAPLSTKIAQVRCATSQEGEEVAAYAWVPWQ
jgi:hypothetical protein